MFRIVCLAGRGQFELPVAVRSAGQTIRDMEAPSGKTQSEVFGYFLSVQKVTGWFWPVRTSTICFFSQ
jgi:hypothetical protein